LQGFGLFLNGGMQAPYALEYGFYQRCFGGIRKALIVVPFGQRRQPLLECID